MIGFEIWRVQNFHRTFFIIASKLAGLFQPPYQLQIIKTFQLPLCLRRGMRSLDIIISKVIEVEVTITMLTDLADYWCKSTFKQKVGLFQQMAIELFVIIVVGFVFFWCTFLFTWLIALFIGVQPYLQVSTPNFHMRSLMPDSLLTIYVHKPMKKDACQMGPDHLFFSELTVPYHQYCNIEQLPLPAMKAPVDISISDVETDKIAYITSCIKHLGREVSCQKYPGSNQLLLFRSVDFHGLYYLQIELHLKKSTEPFQLSYTPKVQFEEQCGFLTRFIKQYYGIFMIVFSYGITALLTVGVIVFRLAKIVQNCYQNKESKESQTKLAKTSSSQIKTQKSSTMSVPASVIRNPQVESPNLQQQNMRKEKMVKEPQPTNEKSSNSAVQHEKKQ